MNETTFSLASWVLNLAHPVASCEDWIGMVKEALAESKAKGMDMLLFPEYACEQWMKFAPADIKPTGELAWMAGQALSHNVIDKLQEAVKETGVALAAGSIPWPVEGKDGAYTNRTWILFPDRDPVVHDKLVMTPFEKSPAGWTLDPGKEVVVFEWRNTRMALVICLDIEMPDLAAKLADKDIDLLLVPSMTEKLSGYHRVFACAKARAIELMLAVGVVGCTGNPWHGDKIRPGNHSGAAVFVPCEEILGFTGLFGEIPVMNKAEGKGPILFSKDIPVGLIRRLRTKGAEAWPGPWDAGHVKIST